MEKMIISEDYCTYEVAKLLKEKGFDEECEWYYPKDGGEMEQLLLDELNYDYQRGQFIKSPSHALAMKWLREVHRKYIDIRYNNQSEKYRFIVFTMVKDKPIDFIHSEFYSTYEEAVEAAIKYSLENLIEL